MSESEPKFVERVLTADSSRFKSAPEREEKLTAYQKKVRKDQEKKQQEKESSRKQSRKDRLAQSAPYPTNLSSESQPKKLSNDQILALETKSQPKPLSYDQILALETKSQPKPLSTDQKLPLNELEDIYDEREISDVKRVLDVTPSKPVPDGINPFTPTELERSERREEVTYQPSELNFNDEYDGMGFDLNEQLPEEKGGRKRKSRKLRKSKKSRKSKRKTTRKVRRHRRR